MKIQSKFLGEITVTEKDIFDFEEGLPGFKEYTKFALLPIDSDLPIAILQSTEESEIGFIIAFPFSFKKDYSFELTEDEKYTLKLSGEDDALTYSILTLRDPFHKSTLNLLAPIVLNVKEQLGKQLILQDHSKYSLRYPIQMTEGGLT